MYEGPLTSVTTAVTASGEETDTYDVSWSVQKGVLINSTSTFSDLGPFVPHVSEGVTDTTDHKGDFTYGAAVLASPGTPDRAYSISGDITFTVTNCPLVGVTLTGISFSVTGDNSCVCTLPSAGR